jgi:hypothetical protein
LEPLPSTRGVPGAIVKREFSPEGLVFTIEIPMKETNLVKA